MDAFDRLELEHKRTMFCLYGALYTDGTRADGVYFKQAHSLREALADLAANPAMLDVDYLVRDLFLEETENDATVHVELVTVNGEIDEEVDEKWVCDGTSTDRPGRCRERARGRVYGLRFGPTDAASM